MRPQRLLTALSAIALLSSALLQPPLAAQPAAPALKIVVIEGEGAVNIIQQKTAIAPVIEVRDRNDQPVAGAIVQFVVRNGRATFGGARALSVTTNAAGRAVAAGFTPTGSGAVQIGATAAFQGQSAAAVTIAQTNVMTAAQAAAAASTTSSTGSGTAAGGGAGAGGGGGGLSLTTIGIIGGAAAAGVVAAQELSPGKIYAGTASGVLLDTDSAVDSNFSCTREQQRTAEIEVRNFEEKDGRVSGDMNVDERIQLAPGTCVPDSYNTSTRDFGLPSGTLSGPAQNITMSVTQSYTDTTALGTAISAQDYTFTGTFDGTQISGVLTVVQRGTWTSSTGYRSTSRGSIRYDVVLR